MANKYEIRRRALKDSQSRVENPYASPRYGARELPSSYAAYAPPPPMDRKWITAGVCCGLVLIISLLYLQTARHSFTVCDDNVYIYENPMVIQGLTWKGVKWAWDDSHAGNWHPLTWMSHMLDWQLFGTWQEDNKRYVDSWPGGHHLMNMAIHCANAVLLFLALRVMTGTLWPSVVVTALFAIHPLRVESVAWSAERKDVLCGLFWMAAMLAYAFYARRRPLLQSSHPEAAATLGLYALVTLFFGLALLAKSMAVTLPCVFLLLDAWPLNRWRKALWPRGRNAAGPDYFSAARLFIEKLPWFAMVLYDAQQTIVGQDKGVALNSWEGLPLLPRLVNSLISIAAYLGQMVWPAGMAPFYGHPYMLKSGWSGWGTAHYIEAVIGGIILVSVTAAVGWFWRRSYLAVGWFWFLGTLMPVIGIMQVGTQSRADRYTYLPMIGVSLMIVWLCKEAADRRPQIRIGLAAAACLVFTVLSAITFQQVSYWIDSYRLFDHALQVTDNNWFAYNHVGIAYDSDAKKMSNLDGAEAKELFDYVSKYFKGPPQYVDPSRPQLWQGYSKEDFKAAASKLDRTQEQQLLFDYSAEAFKSAIDIKPDYDFGNNNLGVYFARPGPSQSLKLAETYFRGALASNARYADALNNLAIVLDQQGKYDEAIACHKRGMTVRNDKASDHNNLCRVYMHKQDLENALKENTIALQCDPSFTGAWMSRADIGLLHGKFEEAGQCVLRMVALAARAGETLQAQATFANKCVEAHRPDDAINLLSQSLQINPSIPQVYRLRAIVYLQKHDFIHAKEDVVQLLKIAPDFPGGQELLAAIDTELAKQPK